MRLIDEPGAGIVNLEILSADFQRWGIRRGLFILGMGWLEQHAGFHLYRIFVRPLAREYPELDPRHGITLRMVLRDELVEAADDPELDLSPQFVRDALARGDECVGAFDGEKLVAYAWRTVTAAPHADGLWVRAERPHLYGYKGYTRDSYRGRHLATSLSRSSDAHFMKLGYTDQLDIVEVSNFPSLLSQKRKGSRPVGYAGYVAWFGRSVPFRTPAVKKIGLEWIRGAKAAEATDCKGGPARAPAQGRGGSGSS